MHAANDSITAMNHERYAHPVIPNKVQRAVKRLCVYE